MKILKSLFIAGVLFAISSFVLKNETIQKIKKQPREFYQIKTYILSTDQQVQTTDKFLEEA
ncbi:MAG: hypothetical protein ACI9L6_001292 [Flavobacterium sp.]|jgi:hypothetical protein